MNPEMGSNRPYRSIPDKSNSVIVIGFDEDSKEEEIIGHFYRIVYGGGTRNVNDGKVHSCQIFTIPNMSKILNPFSSIFSTDLRDFSDNNRIAIVTFDSSELAEVAL